MLARRDALRFLAAAGAGMLFDLPAPADAAQSLPPDYLDSASRVLEGFVRAEGDSSGKQAVIWTTGSVYAWLPGQGGHHLFDQHSFSVRRFVRTDGGWLRLSREAGVHLDKDTGEVLDTWSNPYTRNVVRVSHPRSGASTRPFVVSGQAGAGAPPIESWRYSDRVCFCENLLVTRPAELKVAEHPLRAQGDIQKAADLTNLFVNASDLANPKLSSIPVIGSHTRLENWLPWMEMGQRRGWLLLQLRSKKLASIADLPAPLVAYWKAREPALFHAPASDGEAAAAGGAGRA